MVIRIVPVKFSIRFAKNNELLMDLLHPLCLSQKDLMMMMKCLLLASNKEVAFINGEKVGLIEFVDMFS